MNVKEKREYLKVGRYTAGNSKNGVSELIERDFYGQGMVVKDEEAYLDADHPHRICYIPELSDSLYTRQDFLDMCKGQREFADELFYACDWQHPESLMNDWIIK